MLRRAVVATTFLLTAALCWAQPQNYAMRGTQVRAGVLLIESSQQGATLQPANPSPHVFYNLDSDLRVKPAGWNIYNPNAPSQVSPEILNRWTLISGSLGGGATPPTLGQRINKRNAAYWEVRLSQVTDVQLSQYDILLLNASGNVSLNPAEREKLRQFMDRGGVLWVEVGQVDETTFSGVNVINNFPLPFAVTLGSNGPGRMDVFHPVLNYPYSFNITNLGYLNGNANKVISQANPIGVARTFNNSVVEDWYNLKPVVVANNSPTLMVGRMGDGFMVVTSRNAAAYLNQLNIGTGYFTNKEYFAGDPKTGSDIGTDTIGKLVINMISLGSSSEQPGKGAHKSSSSSVDITAPLLKRFSTTVPTVDQGPTTSFPVAAYKGIVVVSSQNRIYVYDANPRSDLDGDGNPDDGSPDFALGSNVDLLWRSNDLNGPISAPTCTEVANPISNAIPKDQIFVTQADGSVVAFNAFPTNPGTQQIMPGPFGPAYTVPAPPNSSGSTNSVDTTAIGHGPYAPTVHEGYAYVATNPGGIGSVTGCVWVFNPSEGLPVQTGNRWLIGDPTAPIIQEITAAPTVGYIPIVDNSGGFDKVVYVPTRPKAGVGGPNAGIYSLWVGARGESPLSVTKQPDEVNTTGITVVTRASTRGLWLDTTPGNRNLRITLIQPNGDPLPADQINTIFNGTVTQSSPGVLDFQFNGVNPMYWNNNLAVRVDYTIDWGRGVAASASILRGFIFLPDDGQNRRHIVGNIAMSPRGTIYVVQSSMNSSFTALGSTEGGAFYAFREQGQGAFNCITRYDAYRTHTVNLNQASPQQVVASVSDNDPLTGLVPPGILSGRTACVTFMSGPAVRGDFVYAAGIVRKTTLPIIPHTVLFAFKSEPEAPEIQVDDLAEGFQLVQPDMLRSPNKTTPTFFNTPGTGQYQYLRESGKIRFNSLTYPNRGQISTAYSLSQPIIIRSGGRPDRLVYPDAKGGSRWSPLSWFTILHGFDNPTTPVVTGGTLFIGGKSALPSIVVNGFAGGRLAFNGVFNAFNADISESDPFTVADPVRPWLRQVNVLQNDGGGFITANPNIRWPQNQGIKTFEAWALRVLQASMPNSPATLSIAAGEGGLFATGTSGAQSAYGNDGVLYGFSRSDFIICDEGRLGRYDPAGNPLMATDVTSNSGPEANIGAATGIRSIQRPTRAYPIGNNDIVVVDPPTNRIMRLDSGGREVRSLESFRMDNASGITLAANEPLTFSNPRDVAAFTEFVANPGGVTNPQALEFWVHYVVADAGNRRVIDLIDRYYADPSTRAIGDAVLVGSERQLGVLRWHSPAEYSGKRFEYSSITRAADLVVANRYWYIVGIGSATPTRVDVGLDNPGGTLPREAKDGNGGIVIFSPTTGQPPQVINEVNIPAINGNIFMDLNGVLDPTPRAASTKKLVNLTSVTARTVLVGGTSTWAIMFSDSTGVYEVIDPSHLGTTWTVNWMMPNAVYKVLRNRPGAPANVFQSNPAQLRANYARRLDSGDVLIVNGFVGKRLDGTAFAGEVVQVDGAYFDITKPNFNFSFGSVQFEIHTLADTRSLYQPVFADRR